MSFQPCFEPTEKTSPAVSASISATRVPVRDFVKKNREELIASMQVGLCKCPHSVVSLEQDLETMNFTLLAKLAEVAGVLRFFVPKATERAGHVIQFSQDKSEMRFRVEFVKAFRNFCIEVGLLSNLQKNIEKCTSKTQL
ncbi:hypothetical protein FVE85_3558 [Porphyridium purpureum]|uniref:Uncharacterized protein n=1 Tax=Porphyridium purpureum TaxID=35688 RepID=A0A5J4YMF5_PORPP|nr:hypothetical protein FVE85_3558 [Porphyridium purpureum]|eukprot:POR6945..scf249_10